MLGEQTWNAYSKQYI